MHHASIVHQIEGRLRIRVPSARNDTAFFARVRELFGNMQGIRSVETNYLTGSILFQHAIDPQEIQNVAAREGLFEINGESAPLPAAAMLQERLSSMQARLSRFSKSRVDFQGAVLLLFLGGGLVQVLRKNVWPAGVTLLWYSANLLKDAKTSPRLNSAVGPTQSGRDYIQ